MAIFGLILAAQAAAASDDRLEEIQVTATRRAQAVNEVISSVSVIGADALNNTKPKVVIDALRGTPGVFVQQTTPGQGIPIVRGLKGSQVLHLVDGLRLNNAFFRNAPSQYLALVDPSDIERIEIVRGPGSTLHGSDAMGGVVQLLSKRPQYGESTTLGGEVALSSAELARRGRLFVNHGSEDTAMRGHVAYQDIGDRRTGDGDRIKPTGYRSRAFGLGWRQRLAEGRELLLDADYLEQPSTPRADELNPGFGETEPASSEFFFEPNRRSAVTLHYQDQAIGLADSLKVVVGAQRIEDDRRTRGLDATRRRVEQNTSDLLGLSAQLNHTLAWGDLSWGLEFNHDEVTSRRQEVDLATGQSDPVAARFPSGSTIRGAAAFANANVALTDATEVALGARYSDFRIELASREASPGASLAPSDTNFSLGLRRQLTDRTSLVASIGEGFRAPNIFDLGTLGARPGNRFNIANTELAPESILSSELGLKYASSDYALEGFVYYSDFSDKIVSVITGEQTADGRQITQSANAASAILYGAELAARGRVLERGEAYLNLNWVRGSEQIDGATEPADRVPPLNGSAGFSWQFNDRLDGELYANFAAEQDRLSNRDRRDPRINPQGTAGWAILNARLDWRMSARWSTQLTVNNLFDKAYREHGSGLDRPGRDVGVTFSFQ